MKRHVAACLMGLSIFLSAPAFGAPLLLQGNVTSQRVHELTTEIPWNQSLYGAQLEARREGKMVFWVHMLGDIKGAT